MDQGSSMLLGIEGLRVLDVRLDAGKQPGESQVRPIKLGTFPLKWGQANLSQPNLTLTPTRHLAVRVDTDHQAQVVSHTPSLTATAIDAGWTRLD